MFEKAQTSPVESVGSDHDVTEADERQGLAPASAGDRGQAAESERHDAPASRPCVSPSLLAEIQAVLLPLGTIAASLVSAALYFDLFQGAPRAPDVLRQPWRSGRDRHVFSRQPVQPSLHFGHRIGPDAARDIFATVSLGFLLLLCLFYLLKTTDEISRGWIACWYTLSLGLLFAARFGILCLGASVASREPFAAARGHLRGPELIERVLSTLFVKDRNLILAGAFSESTDLLWGGAARAD